MFSILILKYDVFFYRFYIILQYASTVILRCTRHVDMVMRAQHEFYYQQNVIRCL